MVTETTLKINDDAKFVELVADIDNPLEVPGGEVALLFGSSFQKPGEILVCARISGPELQIPSGKQRVSNVTTTHLDKQKLVRALRHVLRKIELNDW